MVVLVARKDANGVIASKSKVRMVLLQARVWLEW